MKEAVGLPTSSWLAYYKIADVESDSIVFYHSLMSADASYNIVLNHFDEHKTIAFSRSDLKDIRDGKWKRDSRSNTTLVEIVRRQ